MTTQKTPLHPYRPSLQLATRRLAGLVAFILLASAPRLLGQAVEIGIESDVSSNPAHCVDRFDVAMAADGRFVVAWKDSSTASTFVRRFAADGSPLAPDEALRGAQGFSWIATDIGPDGDFLVVWENPTVSGSVLEAQRYTADGSASGSLLTLSNTTEQNEQPEIAIAPDGSFVVAWRKGTTGSHAIEAARFDSAGSPLGGQFAVDPTPVDHEDPEIAMSPADGRFAVTWTENDASTGREVEFRAYAADGNPSVGAGTVNSHLPGSQSFPDVAVDAAGGYEVTWSGSDTSTSFASRVARYSPGGVKLGEERIDLTDGRGAENSIAISNDGGSRIVVWKDTRYLENSSVQERDILGSMNEVLERSVGTLLTGTQEHPQVVMDDLERALVVWKSQTGAGSCYRLKAQRFQLYRTPVSYPVDAVVHSLGLQGAWKYYVYFPGGPAEVTVTLENLPGAFPQDADLFVRFGDFPRLSDFHCRSNLGGSSDESCTVFSSGPPVLIGVNGFHAGRIPFTLDVQKVDALFYDDFEAGNTGAWSSATP